MEGYSLGMTTKTSVIQPTINKYRVTATALGYDNQGEPLNVPNWTVLETTSFWEAKELIWRINENKNGAGEDYADPVLTPYSEETNENVLEIREYEGNDGRVRYLIIVDSLVHDDSTHWKRGKRTNHTPIRELRHGYGVGPAIVVDDHAMRYQGSIDEV